MKHPALFLSVAVAALHITGCAHTPAPKDAYTLTVELNTPYNEGYTMAAVIALDEPFELTKLNGDINNTLSGVLRPSVDGRFPLDLTVSEWESEKSNITGSTGFEVELDKPWSGGPIASFFFAKTVTLSKR